MDFYDSRYFIWNKNMQIFLGVWPYQSLFEGRIRLFAILFSLGFSLVPQANTLYKYGNKDLTKTIYSVTFLSYVSGIMLKLLCFNGAKTELRRVYERLAKNHDLIVDKEERKILEYHSEMGRIKTIGYLAYMILATIIFDTLPYSCQITKKVMSTNNTCQNLYITDGEYFIKNKDTYFGLIYIYEAFCIAITVPIFCAFDSMYALCVEHGVAILEIIRFRLSTLQLSSNPTGELFDLNHTDKSSSVRTVIKCIKLHQEVYDSYQVLESASSTTFLYVLGVMIICICSSGLIFSENLSNPYEAVRYVMVMFGMIIHLVYLMNAGQKLLDLSGGIAFDTYNNEWYECSRETKLLLLFMMQRSQKPFQLTAGRVYIMNFESFGMIMKVSLSYYMVLSSFQKI